MSDEVARRNYYPPAGPGAGLYPADAREPGSLGDLLERVLDKGLVIAGDIQVNLLDIELLTIKLRLLVASVETARQMGIDWWERDPWLSSRNRADHGLPMIGDTAGDAVSGDG